MSRTRARKADLPRVAIVGRPNVGKSTLFNRLVGRREAIVHDRPGVTRDRLEREVELAGRAVRLWDTGGLVPDTDEALARAVTEQALAAVREADLILFVIDGRAGVTPLDEEIAARLREVADRVLLVVNKLDTGRLADAAADGWRLGLGEPLPLSAEHGIGLERLVDAAGARLPASAPEGEAEEREELSVAVVGRPNVGKSSLINRLAGAERVTVSPVPGTTRDAVDVVLVRDGRRYRIVDTAGLRRSAKAAADDERIGMLMTRRRLERCQVAVLVLDAPQGLTSQDVAIAGEIAKSAKPFVIALNKWDLVSDPDRTRRDLEAAIDRRLGFASYAPRLSVSAVEGRRVFRLLDTCRAVAEAASRRIPTSELNRFLQAAVAEHLSRGGSSPKMLYATQIGTLPPRFVVFCRDPGRLSAPLRRFLEGRLRDAFQLGPTPVVVTFRRPPRRPR
ncbi:MAG: ribosome biogenesis GTPase Der [Acidobacteria bacterium]|nr:MAG: ribosome biogenesis GTPase Der [Acidobacteriota bacterium]